MGLFDEPRRITQSEADRVRWLAEFRLERLNIDERNFIEGICDRLEQYELDTFFSEGQVRFLESIEGRYA